MICREIAFAPVFQNAVWGVFQGIVRPAFLACELPDWLKLRRTGGLGTSRALRFC